MRCGICFAGTRRRNTVDKYLLRGESLRSVARRFGFSEDQVGRHRARHLQRALVQAAYPGSVPQDNGRDDYGASLLAEIQALKADAHRLQMQAERRRDLRVAIRALDSRLKIVETQARMVGVLETTSKSVSVNFDVAVSEADAQRIVAAYLATRQPPALAANYPVPSSQDAPEFPGTPSPKTSVHQPKKSQPAQSPAEASQEGEPCTQSKSNGKIV